MSSETVSTVVKFGDLDVSTDHLNRLLTCVYNFHHDVHPFLSYKAAERLKPEINIGMGDYVPNRDRTELDESIRRTAPVAGKLLVGLSGGKAPLITTEEASEARTGLRPYLPRWGAMAEMTADATDEEVTHSLNLVAKGLPVPSGLGFITRYIQRKAGARIDAARPYIEAISRGDQPEVSQELQHGIKDFLNLTLDTARQNAASRGKTTGAGAKPDKHLERGDVAAGIEQAIRTILTDDNANPMLRGLTLAALARFGKTEADVIKTMDTKAFKWGLEIATDIVIPSLLSALSKQEQQQFAGLLKAATHENALSLASKTLIKSSMWMPGKTILAATALWVSGKSAGQANTIARTRKIHKFLRRNLSGAVWALNGLLPSGRKDVIARYYNALQNNFGVQQRIGSVAVGSATA